MKSKKQALYRVVFYNQDIIYEVYAREVGESDMFNFIEIADLVFGEGESLLVDPSVEKLRNEFKNVNRFYVPIHMIVRVDEVSKEGVSKIRKVSEEKEGNVSRFPSFYRINEEETV